MLSPSRVVQEHKDKTVEESLMEDNMSEMIRKDKMYSSVKMIDSNSSR
jgi:hypothetical protein